MYATKPDSDQAARFQAARIQAGMDTPLKTASTTSPKSPNIIEPESETQPDDENNLFNVVGRPGGSMSVKKNAQHVNNKTNFLAIFYVGLAVIIMGSLVYYLGFATQVPAKPTLLAAAVNPTLTVTPTRERLEVGMPRPTAQPVQVVVTQIAVTAIAVLPPSDPVIEVTFSPTITPSPSPTYTPTFSVDVVLAVKTYWSEPWATKSRTVSGLAPKDVKGFGAACPVDIPLGSELHTRDGKTWVCVDRADFIKCDAGLCTIVVYTDEMLPAIQDASIVVRPLVLE
jgi:hypothetical protein